MQGYKSLLNEQETEHAIKLIKDTFQINLSTALHLRRVTAPLFVKSGLGLNDNLSGSEQPVTFTVKCTGEKAEIVHSLAKWKRYKLGEMRERAGNGLYTDMNAIRTEENLDELHSLYVDQWDWEKVMRADERNKAYLRKTVGLIYQSIKNTEYIVCEHYPQIKPFLPEDITFITSEELLQKYPDRDSKERENAICREFGAVFVENIGGRLSNGEAHDSRAADYDDWELNGDILIWYPLLEKAVELSSMGIRVDAKSLRKQLHAAHHEDWEKRMYHHMVLHDELPLTIGGGIGQSRLCMVLLHKVHVGEIQVSIWPDEMVEQCGKAGIPIL